MTNKTDAINGSESQTMIPVQLHFRNVNTVSATMPCVPYVGLYVKTDKGLWVVASVVIGDGKVNVYLARASTDWASTLAAEWDGWTQPGQEVNADA
jgi:hypothetical protein